MNGEFPSVSVTVTEPISAPSIASSLLSEFAVNVAEGAELPNTVAVTEPLPTFPYWSINVILEISELPTSGVYPDEPATVGSPTSPSWNIFCKTVLDGLVKTGLIYLLYNAYPNGLYV